MSAQLRLVKPRHENRSVPVRLPNDELRSREYLTVAEVERLVKAAQHGRYGHRDANGLRAAEKDQQDHAGKAKGHTETACESEALAKKGAGQKGRPDRQRVGYDHGLGSVEPNES